VIPLPELIAQLAQVPIFTVEYSPSSGNGF